MKSLATRVLSTQGLLATVALLLGPAQSGASTTAPGYGVEPQFSLLKFGEVMPTGWIR